MEFSVKLNSVEDAVNFVNELEYQDCHADIWMDSKIINARALMGILSIGMGKELKVLVYRGNAERLNTVMQQYKTPE